MSAWHVPHFLFGMTLTVGIVVLLACRKTLMTPRLGRARATPTRAGARAPRVEAPTLPMDRALPGPRWSRRKLLVALVLGPALVGSWPRSAQALSWPPRAPQKPSPCLSVPPPLPDPPGRRRSDCAGQTGAAQTGFAQTGIAQSGIASGYGVQGVSPQIILIN